MNRISEIVSGIINEALTADKRLEKYSIETLDGGEMVIRDDEDGTEAVVKVEDAVCLFSD